MSKRDNTWLSVIINETYAVLHPVPHLGEGMPRTARFFGRRPIPKRCVNAETPTSIRPLAAWARWAQKAPVGSRRRRAGRGPKRRRQLRPGRRGGAQDQSGLYRGSEPRPGARHRPRYPPQLLSEFPRLSRLQACVRGRLSVADVGIVWRSPAVHPIPPLGLGQPGRAAWVRLAPAGCDATSAGTSLEPTLSNLKALLCIRNGTGPWKKGQCASKQLTRRALSYGLQG